MKRVDNTVKSIYLRLTAGFKCAFISAIVFGLIAHMYMFTNKLPNFDDLIGIDGFGATFRNGRWFLWVVGATAYHLDLVFSLPWINGLITLLLIGISAGIIADLLNLESRTANVLLGAALVVFPSWTGTFFYMFTAPYYALAVLMAVISVWLTANYKWGIAPSAFILACSLGIYQSYLPFTATLYVVLLFLMLFDNKCDYICILKRSIWYLLALISGIILYFIFMKLSLFLTGQELRAYKGISSMGQFELSRIPEIIKTIGINFFGIFLNNNMEISYNYITKAMYFVLLVMSAVLIIKLFVSLLKEKAALKAIETVVLSLAYVIAINSIYIMCEDGIYSLMYYSYVFIILFPMVLLDRSLKKSQTRFVTAAEYGIMFAVFIGILSYCHFANGQYISMQLSLEQASSYYTTMITQIKSIEGYRDDMKVVLSGTDIEDETLYHNEVMSTFSMSGRDDALADAYSRQNFILHYCGFQAETADESILSKQSQLMLEEMPVYPDDGSIRILDNAVVVKLSENVETYNAGE